MWLSRFKAVDFNLEDQKRPGKFSTTDEDKIKTLMEDNPSICTMTREIVLQCFILIQHPRAFSIKKCPEIANQKGVVFHEDNAWPHVSLTTRQRKKLQYFGQDKKSYKKISRKTLRGCEGRNFQVS
ncbi:histone-lysine N-methyltransferase SETMAR [Caerostris extrusa]|uniref:Histone-lysine N-methyltransferase SETMAR n=1 Tax=Caerostris extrusa TaxID=172846 RepID=A0AAV4RE29_CAEEX|nr:histone-lysine N-methyltransferase SETMAR [Caerostris extrusa]